MQPLYQIQVLPGRREIPAGVISPGRLIAQWTIDLPGQGQAARGKIAAVEEIEGVGYIALGEWSIKPASPLDRSPQLSLLDLPPGAKLIVETAGYSISRLSLYRYGVPERYQLTDSNSMAISYYPYVPPSSTSEVISVVTASTTVIAVAANPNRLGGYIQNKSNRSMWVKWGASTDPSPLTASLPYTEVPKNSDISIDAGYTGVISFIWSAGFTSGTSGYVHELVA